VRSTEGARHCPQRRCRIDAREAYAIITPVQAAIGRGTSRRAKPPQPPRSLVRGRSAFAPDGGSVAEREDPASAVIHLFVPVPVVLVVGERETRAGAATGIQVPRGGQQGARVCTGPTLLVLPLRRLSLA
jgi:hypothetical protein